MKRYGEQNWDSSMAEEADGPWVKYDEAAAIERENELLKAEIDVLKKQIEQLKNKNT